MNIKKVKKPRLVMRRCIGLQVFAGGVAMPVVYALYEECFSDGSRAGVRGDSLYGLPQFNMLNGTSAQKKKAEQAHRPDLLPIIKAAAVLHNTLTAACLRLDKSRGRGETE